MRPSSRLARPARIRSGTALQTPAGTVSAFFALEGYDRRHRVATYALHVVNGTKSVLLCRTWVVSRSGEPVMAYPVPFEVGPLSTSETRVPVWPCDFSSFDGAVAEIVGEGVRCIVEAPAPAARKAASSYALVAAASLLFGLLAIAAAAALGGLLPRISAFAVPPMALAGTTVRAEYAASGLGKLSYTVAAPDGHQMQGGALAEQSGSIPIALPAAKAEGAYTLRMAMKGPLGSVDATRVLNAINPPLATNRAKVARIGSISVSPIIAKPGQTIDVSYAATAESGYVRLVGLDGAIWGEQPFSRRGEARFAVPYFAGVREMRVVVHVARGRTSAQSTAGLLVADLTSRPVSGDTQVVGDDEPGSGSIANGSANGTFAVLTPRVRSGNPIKIRILSPRNGMRISLADGLSREAAHLDAGTDADEVLTLRAPSVSVPTRYVVVASFTDGFGQESIVQPVTILP